MRISRQRACFRGTCEKEARIYVAVQLPRNAGSHVQITDATSITTITTMTGSCQPLDSIRLEQSSVPRVQSSQVLWSCSVTEPYGCNVVTQGKFIMELGVHRRIGNTTKISRDLQS
nr:hypothetical protein CFP56_12228 [Quercus suber]